MENKSVGRLSHRQRKAESATPICPLALSPNLTPVRLDQMFDDGQANTAATSNPATRFIHSVKAGEEVREMLWRDANAGVADVDQQFSILGFSSDGNRATVGRVLKRITHQVE